MTNNDVHELIKVLLKVIALLSTCHEQRRNPPSRLTQTHTHNPNPLTLNKQNYASCGRKIHCYNIMDRETVH